jgi:spore coat protein A
MTAGAAAYMALIKQAWPFAQTPNTIKLFDTTLRSIGTIGVAAPDPSLAPVTGVTHYTINIDQFQDAGVCPSLGPTTLRGFNPTRLLAGQNNRHLGGIIVGQRGTPIQITFRNNLPGGMHIIPNDTCEPG